MAEAGKCMGKPARTIARSGSVKVDRYQSVILTGKRVKVQAEGDNRVCSTKGNIWLTFGKGRKNMASLGSGNDTVVISHRASSNVIGLGGGNDRIKIKNKAVTHKVAGGSGNDSILLAYKTSNALIDAGGGNDKVTLAAKATRQSIRTGRGNDRVSVRRPARTNHRLIKTGLGNDVVKIDAKGHTTTYLSEKQNPRGLGDTDSFFGGPSNDTVYDYQGGTESRPNVLRGLGGFDKLHSEDSAHSDIYGGEGTDWLYADSSGVSGDRIFGERGNDKLFANQAGGGAKGAYLDGGVGDDWVYGTDAGDTIIALSGIKKLYGYGGDDLFVKTGDGIGTIEGGNGYDTISYVAHTPPGYGNHSGVMVNLGSHTGMNGKGVDTITGMEHLIGSAFDDLLTGDRSVATRIDGGIGDDEITAYPGDDVDGGLGQNLCDGGKQVRCNRESPGQAAPGKAILDIGEEGLMSILGSSYDDRINVGYDPTSSAFIIDTSRPAATSRACQLTNTPDRYRCPVPRQLLSTVTVEAGDGNDEVTVDYSVPAEVSAIINAGPGSDTVTGGKTKDYVNGAEKAFGRDGNDQLRPVAGSITKGGGGSDSIHGHNPCQGGIASGGSGRDGLVFAGADTGVKLSLKDHYAKWNGRSCSSPMKLKNDLEGVEGTSYNDVLIGQKRGSGKTSFLGRKGVDRFYAKNGVKDTVTTGSGGHRNKVYADRVDKVIWGWGLAAY